MRSLVNNALQPIMTLVLISLMVLLVAVSASPIDQDREWNSADAARVKRSFTDMWGKRAGSKGFHEGIFNDGFGAFSTLKKRGKRAVEVKRRPEMTSRGIHGDAFTSDESDDTPVSQLHETADIAAMDKRRPEMDTNGFYGDTFKSGFGDFYTSRRSDPDLTRLAARYIVHKRAPYLIHKRAPYLIHKRAPAYLIHKRMSMGTNGFHGDTFSSGFGDFMTAKKRFTNSFHGDTFSDGFGDFNTVKKRGFGSDSAFHPNTFSDGFGDFATV